MLRRWGIEKQEIGIIKRIDEVSYTTVKLKGGADVSSVSPSSNGRYFFNQPFYWMNVVFSENILAYF